MEERKEEAKKCQYEKRNKKEGVNEEREGEMNFLGKKEREEGPNYTKKNEQNQEGSTIRKREGSEMRKGKE